MPKQKIVDKYGNEYTNRLARFLGNLNNEVSQMNNEAKMIPVNAVMKRDKVEKGFWNNIKKVFSVFKRKN